MAICPTIDPNNPPLPPLPPAIRFLQTAKDVYALDVTFDDFLRDGKVAPGGNVYWTKKVDISHPRLAANTNGVRTATNMAMAISHKMFESQFGAGKPHAAMLMKDVQSKYKDMLVTGLGVIKVPVAPKPTERADAFVERGGYLLWIGGWAGFYGGGGVTGQGAGVFGRYLEGTVAECGSDRLCLTQGTNPISKITVPGLPAEVHDFELHLAFDWKHNKLKYVIRLEYDGAWDKVKNAFTAAAAWLKDHYCAMVTNENLTLAASTAATAAASTGSAAGAAATAAYAAWQLSASLCGKTIPPCEMPPPPTMPPGTLAYFDKKLSAYQIAVPKGLAGFEPTHTITGQTYPTVPPGAQVVGIIGWQNATQTWYRRTWVQGVAAGVVLLGGAAVVVKVRQSRTSALVVRRP